MASVTTVLLLLVCININLKSQIFTNINEAELSLQ